MKEYAFLFLWVERNQMRAGLKKPDMLGSVAEKG